MVVSDPEMLGKVLYIIGPSEPLATPAGYFPSVEERVFPEMTPDRTLRSVTIRSKEMLVAVAIGRIFEVHLAWITEGKVGCQVQPLPLFGWNEKSPIGNPPLCI